jgi:CBS domain-containing protein
MEQHHVGAVLVVKNGHAVGVATEQDCARDSRVENVMSAVVCAPQQMTVREAMAIMAERQLSHLPVLDDHKDVVGVVSIGMLSQETLAA